MTAQRLMPFLKQTGAGWIGRERVLPRGTAHCETDGPPLSGPRIGADTLLCPEVQGMRSLRFFITGPAFFQGW